MKYSQDPYLSHYGVPGMKWGIRKQRPSLGLQRPSYGSQRTPNTSNRKGWKGLSKNQKTALKIGAALIGGAALAYGGYKLSKAHAGKTAIKAAQNVLRKQGHTNLKSIAMPSYRVSVSNYDTGLNATVYANSRSRAKAIAKKAPGISRIQKGHMVTTYIPGADNLDDRFNDKFIPTNPGSLKGMVNYLRTH